MNQITNALAPVKPIAGDSQGERDLMLAALRVAGARARLIGNQIDTIAANLRQKAITCQEAVAWAKREKLIDWIALGPEVAR
jgi:hypothetical protein